jgi:ribonuclease HII
VTTMPNRAREMELFASGYSTIACVDEVGRGAIAGPVLVGIVVVESAMTMSPQGIRDSKLLSSSARESLLPQISSWAICSTTGEASAREIDDLGIMGALALATQRGLSSLATLPQAVLLDGNTNFLSQVTDLPVFTEIKGDVNCLGVAAASVIAKVTRDSLMCELDQKFPGYSWSRNKGYASAQHVQALRSLGVSPEHRTSWKLPGIDGE